MASGAERSTRQNSAAPKIPSTLPGDRADEPAQTERPHAQFKNDDRAGSRSACCRADPAMLDAERMKEITNASEKATKRRRTTTRSINAYCRWQRNNYTRLGTIGEYDDTRAPSSSK